MSPLPIILSLACPEFVEGKGPCHPELVEVYHFPVILSLSKGLAN